jgi:hypothetical protein
MKLRESATLNAFGHIEPIPTFHPPSLKNPTRIPADNPKEKSNKFLDKMMRKSKRTKKHRKELARHQGPQQMPHVTTTGVSMHQQMYIPYATASGVRFDDTTATEFIKSQGKKFEVSTNGKSLDIAAAALENIEYENIPIEETFVKRPSIQDDGAPDLIRELGCRGIQNWSACSKGTKAS